MEAGAVSREEFQASQSQVKDWQIGVVIGSGVYFTGTREEAQDHANAYFAFLETLFKEKGMLFMRKEHTIRVRGSVNVEDESVDDSTTEAGIGELTE